MVEWMAATNLYPYADMFRCKDIKGSDLMHLDKDKLIVSTLPQVLRLAPHKNPIDNFYATSDN